MVEYEGGEVFGLQLIDNWDNKEPSPIEFFHSELSEEFHKFRKGKTESVTVEINGSQFSEIVRLAKLTTYEKYQALNLREPVLKVDLWNQERTERCFKELGFELPTNEDELNRFNEKFKDFPHQLTGKSIDPQKILDRIKSEAKK